MALFPSNEREWRIAQLAARRKREGQWEVGPLGEEGAARAIEILFVGLACQGRRGAVYLLQLLVNSIGRPSEPGRVVCDILKRTCVISHEEERRTRRREGRQEAKIPDVALNPI